MIYREPLLLSNYKALPYLIQVTVLAILYIISQTMNWLVPEWTRKNTVKQLRKSAGSWKTSSLRKAMSGQSGTQSLWFGAAFVSYCRTTATFDIQANAEKVRKGQFPGKEPSRLFPLRSSIDAYNTRVRKSTTSSGKKWVRTPFEREPAPTKYTVPATVPRIVPSAGSLPQSVQTSDTPRLYAGLESVMEGKAKELNQRREFFQCLQRNRDHVCSQTCLSNLILMSNSPELIIGTAILNIEHGWQIR